MKVAASSIITLKSLDLSAIVTFRKDQSETHVLLHVQCLPMPHTVTSRHVTEQLNLIGRDKILSQNNLQYRLSPDPSFLAIGGVARETSIVTCVRLEVTFCT